MKWWAGCCGLLLALGNACATEAQPNLNWLKTLAIAGHQAEYSGVFVYQYENRLETTRVSHLVESDSEYEKLESLDNPNREIIRHHGQVWSYLNHKMVQVDSEQGQGGFPALSAEQLSVLNGNYEIKDMGLGNVAGYSTQVLLFQPKDNLRYAHKFWVHSDTGLLLKAAVMNEKNQVVEQYAFTEIKIGKGVDRSWLAASKSSDKSALTQAKVASSVASPYNSGWVADALPTGFKKLTEVLRPMHGKHAPVTQMVFADGLSAISIFIEPSDEDEDDVEGFTSRGAVNLYHKVVDKHLYTVVGEVPPRAVMQVLESIRYNGQ